MANTTVMVEREKMNRKPTEIFGQRLSTAIRSAGYASVQQFCLDKKYDTTYVYKWIRGAHYPRPEAIKRLADDLRVRAGWLLFGEGEAAVQDEDHETKIKGRLEPNANPDGRPSILRSSRLGAPIATTRKRRRLRRRRDD